MCIKLGLENLKLNGVLVPSFNGKVATKLGSDNKIIIEGIQVINLDNTHLTEDYYVLK